MNRKQTKKEKGENPQLDEKLKVHYFYIRGKCQPIRNLLYYLNIQFDDVMHDKSKENECEVGYNMGLPKIVDKDIVVHEAIAIMSYICKKYNKSHLIGETPQSFARTQEVLMKYTIQRNKIFGIIFESFREIFTASNKEQYVDNILKKMMAECKFVQFCLKNTIKTKRYIFGDITLADFLFYQICYYLVGFYQQFIKNNFYFRHFIEYKYFFETLPFFEKQKAKIEEKFLFYEYNNKEINKEIEKLWKGKQNNIIRRKAVEV